MESINFKIGIVEYDLSLIVKEWITPEYREEARDILRVCIDNIDPEITSDLIEFVIYYEKKMGNIICAHLDFIKARLIKKELMSKGGAFGMPFTN